MSELPKNHNESEDLFDFPQVEGFSPEFIETYVTPDGVKGA